MAAYSSALPTPAPAATAETVAAVALAEPAPIAGACRMAADKEDKLCSRTPVEAEAALKADAAAGGV